MWIETKRLLQQCGHLVIERCKKHFEREPTCLRNYPDTEMWEAQARKEEQG